MPPERVGLLIIRVWVEAGGSPGLRAHVRSTTDVSAGLQRTVVAADVEAVLATVGDWLAEVLVGGCDGGDGVPAERS